MTLRIEKIHPVTLRYILTDCKFEYCLKHIPTGLYVSYNGLSQDANQAYRIISDAAGIEISDFIAKAIGSNEWLTNIMDTDLVYFEIELIG